MRRQTVVMRTFKVKAFGESPLSRGQVVGYPAPGLGVLVVQAGTGWVKRQDGSREIIEGPSVVLWDSGDWVEYGSDAGFQTLDYWAATEPEEEFQARLSQIFGDEGAADLE